MGHRYALLLSCLLAVVTRIICCVSPVRSTSRHGEGEGEVRTSSSFPYFGHFCSRFGLIFTHTFSIISFLEVAES